ncbi:SusC/RagA family TonB-linked outer membrane protein [Pedobacter sp. Hv1]|uniref:SusC/RagA family TonB-linked outer membrane protein n=1 Tax=Pedobacter sp. Hv1 TaxID=1740090 RepID=UPI001379174B|nr:SusC/RagA family TonB-linked outer membrane protein [Pedobacter sp. Hv1]
MYKNYTNKIGMPNRHIAKIWLIMRLTTVILIATLMQVSAASLAQRVTLNQKKVSLEKVFREIHNQTGYDFLYDKELLDKKERISISANNESLEAVLDKCISDQSLSYSIEDKTIVIKEKKKIFNQFLNIDITGKLVDETGQPIAGATIKVKGTTAVTTSNSEGVFSLKNIADDATLEISYLGYQIKEVKASKDLGTLRMEVAVGKLDQVTVNAGYYTVKDGERTGSISRITSKDIETQPVNNVLAIMQGRMPGVNITQSTGTPGGGFDIKIRGRNSIRTDGNSPLYIIDGVPYASDPIGAFQTTTGFPTIASPLNSINTDNVESIEVLKDADATAIYGSRGANGVILVTTKKGKPGKTKVSINSYKGAGQVTKFLELMNTQEYLTMRKQAFINDGLSNYNEWDYDINDTWDQNRYTDWQKELLGGSAEINNIQGTISGGTVNSQFLISGNYRSESTVLPGDFLYRKGGVQASFTHQSDDHKFKMAFSINYIRQNNDQPSFDFTYDARSLAPNAPALYDSKGNLNWENGTWDNPLRNLKAKFEAKTNDLITNTILSYELLPGLVVKSSFGLTDLSTLESRVTPSDMGNPALNPSSANSTITFNNTNRLSWIIEPQINWSKELRAGKIDVLLGATIQSQNTDRLYQSGTGFSSNSLIYSLAAARTVRVLLSDITQYKYQAFFGRVNYNYNQRYIVNLTARRDGSSRFGPDKRFATFGALGAAWLFSNEHFLKDNTWLSFGKLRASYGITGSDQIGDYQFFNTYATSGVAYGNTIGLQPTRLYNPNFAWETNRKLEIALELGFLQDRLFFTGAWYKNRSSNQLVGIPLPGTTGFTLLQSNLDATVQNSGLELTLRTENLKTKNLTWTTSLNISSSKNKLIRFPGLEGSGYSQQYRIGKSLDIQLLYQYKGINPQTGVYEFVDVNNDNRISFPEDKQTIADLTPKYFGGIQNQITFKKWNLDFLFQFVKQKNNSYPIGYNGDMTNQPWRVLESWLKSGDTGPYQIFTTGNNSSAITSGSLYSASNMSVVDASYIRLKNVSLSYELPLILKGTQCKVSLQGQNLLTFTKYKDGDPEFISYGFLPPLKVVTAGIQLTF